MGRHDGIKHDGQLRNSLSLRYESVESDQEYQYFLEEQIYREIAEEWYDREVEN